MLAGRVEAIGIPTRSIILPPETPIPQLLRGQMIGLRNRKAGGIATFQQCQHPNAMSHLGGIVPQP
jgi:hypothetical protein